MEPNALQEPEWNAKAGSRSCDPSPETRTKGHPADVLLCGKKSVSERQTTCASGRMSEVAGKAAPLISGVFYEYFPGG